MDWKFFLPLSATILAAFGGGWLGHMLSSRRDLVNERRKLRVAYLLEAYRRLESGSNRSESDPGKSWDHIESAIADIQLLGSPDQVQLAQEFIRAMSDQQTASLDGLIYDLRRSLRRELHLQDVEGSVRFLRFSQQDALSFSSTLIKVTRNVADAKVEGASTASPEARKRLDNQESIQDSVAQIIGAWQQLESMIQVGLQNKGISTSAFGPKALVQTALDAGLITEPQKKSLTGLNIMRNLAVHSKKDEINAQKAQEFIELADAMRTVLEISDNAKFFQSLK